MGLPKFTTSELITLWREFGAATASYQEKARLRCKLLCDVDRLRQRGVPLTKARAMTIEKFRKTGGRGISTASLDRWQSIVDGHYQADWPALLLPRYMGRCSEAQIDADLWVRFKTDLLRPDGPTAISCYRRLQLAADVTYRLLPSLKTFLRRLDAEMPLWRQVRRNESRLRQMDLFK